jgi:hypothetical protein
MLSPKIGQAQRSPFWRAVNNAVETTYKAFHGFFLGCPEPDQCPPLWLWALWCVMASAWVFPATFSLWEDEIWMLVASVDQPWRTVLGFADYYSGNHVLYSVLSRILVKASGHHCVEFVYRVPSLLAGTLLLPMSFAVMNRFSGRFCGMAASLLMCFLPAITYHAANARGYMLWCFLTTWTIGLVNENLRGINWPRRTAAYFLLGISHPLALITLAGFGVFGCCIGKKACSLKQWTLNALLCVPAVIYSVPAIRFVRAYHASITAPEGISFISRFSFVPNAMESLFGTPLFPGFSMVFFILAVAGIVAFFRTSFRRGLGLAGLAGIMPLAFVVSGDPFSFDRCFMGSVPIVILLVCRGFEPLKNYFVKHVIAVFSFQVRADIFAAATGGLLMCLWIPKLAYYETCPKQDYRTCIRTYVNKFPRASILFSISSKYFTGLSYYARQFNRRYHVLATPQEAIDSLIRSDNGVRGIVRAVEPGVSDEMVDWTNKNMSLYGEWKGTNLSTVLYVPRYNHRVSLSTHDKKSALPSTMGSATTHGQE